MKEGGTSVSMGGVAGGGSVLNDGKGGSVVAQVPSPSSTSQQPNPNPNLDSTLLKWKRL